VDWGRKEQNSYILKCTI